MARSPLPCKDQHRKKNLLRASQIATLPARDHRNCATENRSPSATITHRDTYLGVGVLFLASTVQGTPPSSRLSLPAMAGSTISGAPYSTNAQVRMSSPMCLTRRMTEVISPYWENCSKGARKGFHKWVASGFGSSVECSKSAPILEKRSQKHQGGRGQGAAVETSVGTSFARGYESVGDFTQQEGLSWLL